MQRTPDESQPSKTREILESFGSALFDDPPEEAEMPVRHLDRETPRQTYVRNFSERWSDFHRAEDEEADGLIGLVLEWAVPLALVAVFSIGRWVIHLSYATQWKLFGGLALTYVAWILWQRTHDKSKADD